MTAYTGAGAMFQRATHARNITTTSNYISLSVRSDRCKHVIGTGVVHYKLAVEEMYKRSSVSAK